MAFVHRVTVPFEDVDYARVVYFARFFSYCHRTFEAFFPSELGLSYAQVIGERNLGFPIVRAEADFHGPLRLGETCRVEMEVVKAKGRSVTCRYRLHRGETGESVAVVTLVVATIAVDTFRSVELPQDVRDALLRHAVPLDERPPGS
jgi:4-hydroxybenzoyl-CoA thioesterase